MKKLLLVVLMAAVPLVGLAMPASAHVDSFTVDSTILTKAKNVRAEGTIMCDQGETVRARLKVNQPDAGSPLYGQANGHFGFDTGQPCTGGVQPWKATLNLRKALPNLDEGAAHFSAKIRSECPTISRSRRGLSCGGGDRAFGHPFDQTFEAHVTLV